MRFTINIFFFFQLIALPVMTQEVHHLEINNQVMNYYICKSDTVKKNEKLLIFLHGSVNAETFKNKQVPNVIELLEGNRLFIEHFNQKGFDIIIPVATGDTHWLNPESDLLLDSIIKKYQQENYSINQTFIAGFSDGATGGYRYFYKNPERYDGLILFNGYFQHNHWNKEVNYINGIGKKIFFLGQFEDKKIPYEFMLMEYKKQKLISNNCYFYLSNGKHEFNKYCLKEFNLITDLLSIEISKDLTMKISQEVTDSINIYPNYGAFFKNEKIIQFYPARNKVIRKYGLDNQFSDLERDKKTLNKILPDIASFENVKKITINDLFNDLKTIDFEIKTNSKSYFFRMTNFFIKY